MAAAAGAGGLAPGLAGRLTGGCRDGNAPHMPNFSWRSTRASGVVLRPVVVCEMHKVWLQLFRESARPYQDASKRNAV